MAIRTKIVSVERVVTDSLACDNCGASIPLVFEEPSGPTQQGVEALQIIFDGGFGMYVDPIAQHNLRLLWCKNCADLLCAAFPSIRELIGRSYKIPVSGWSATDYAYLINNNLGYVSSNEEYWEFDTEENMRKFQAYLAGKTAE